MLLSFFEWLEKSWIPFGIRDSTWLMPLFNTIHEIGMMLLIGSIVFVSLRLLGLVMPRRPVSEIAREMRPGTMVGLFIMLTTGPLLFVPESVRWYESGPFLVKMTLLLLALLFHFTLYRTVTRSDEAGPLLRRFTGAVALVLWFGVGWGGRAITFLE